jgi:hypothetical protein
VHLVTFMLRLIGCLFGICLCANGQCSGLAMPADGSRVYFTTTLRQKDTTEPSQRLGGWQGVRDCRDAWMRRRGNFLYARRIL